MLTHYEETLLTAEDIYNKDYNPETTENSQYCHEQSFKWGFEEGANYEHKYFVEKAVNYLKTLKEQDSSGRIVSVFDEYWLKKFSDVMNED